MSPTPTALSASDVQRMFAAEDRARDNEAAKAIARDVDAEIAASWRCAQITYEHKGQTLLGDVTGAYRDAHNTVRLTVRYFNRDPWPVDPDALYVTVLERTFEEIETEECCPVCDRELYVRPDGTPLACRCAEEV